MMPSCQNYFIGGVWERVLSDLSVVARENCPVAREIWGCAVQGLKTYGCAPNLLVLYNL